MNVSYRWLQSLLPDLDATPEALADHLAVRGFPVEEIRPVAEGLSDIVVARVDAVDRHPNADRLRVCQVDGGGGRVQVVCGADNVEAGRWYPFAPVGASLPGGMTIERVKLRGEASEGMLCSEMELGLGAGHEGLMVLDGEFIPGEPFVDALGLADVRMDVEVTSNRSDLLSHEGVAREIAPGGRGDLHLPEIPGEDAASVDGLESFESAIGEVEASGDGITVRIEAPDRCSRYLGLVVRGVQVGPSPRWLQTRLRAVGARTINNVVDATNYVLLEVGQPLHAFDLGRVGAATVVVRTAAKGESLVTLDGEERVLSPDMLAICDADRPIALAGVMGGMDSQVGEGTTDILLECAHFTPGPIRGTRKALGMSTDASYRFERGVDPEGMLRALLRTARIILSTAGGVITGPVLDCCPRPFGRKRIVLRLERVQTVLGVPFQADDIHELLEPLGFVVTPDEAGTVQVEVPGYRSYDVTREVDLIEEIARIHGYDRFPETLRAFRPSSVPDHPLFLLEDRVRDELSDRGLLEAQTPAFASRSEGDVEILNPISMEEGFLRRDLLPGLLRRVEYNLARGNRDVRLYEVGTVFASGEPGDLPGESTHVAAVLHGLRAPRHWSEPPAAFDIWDVKGILEGLMGLMPAEGLAFRTGLNQGPFDPDAGFTVLDPEGVSVGGGGRILPGHLDTPRWAGEVWGIELALPAEPRAAMPASFSPISAYPWIDRDLALLVPSEDPIGGILGLIREAGGSELRDVRVFDVYRDPTAADGLRSVAVRLRFQASNRTLTSEEVEMAVGRVVRTLREERGVGVRGQDG